MRRQYKKHLTELAKRMRKHPTNGEAILWNYLRGKRMRGVKFYRQFPIDIYILDFYCRKLKLAIEVDGNVHLGYWQNEYDQGRQGDLERLGVVVLRFDEEFVLNYIDVVLEMISDEILKLDPPENILDDSQFE